MNILKIRNDFKILQKQIDGKKLLYFDNACMTLKPIPVINAMNEYYENFTSCAGRSIHKLGTQVTLRYAESREKIQKFINAKHSKEVIFTKNTTESINLVAHTLNLQEGDVVLTTDKEHNSNLIPWHLQKKIRKINHEVVVSNPDNTFNLEHFEQMMNSKVKLVSMTHTSNLDGTCIDAKEMIKIAHEYDALVLLDGAQSTPNKPIDVQKLDVDLFAFSFHKMLGPTGVGILYGKQHILEELEPFIVGGDTVKTSSYQSHTLLDLPEKFEAGLQNYAGALGAAAAVDYLQNIGMNNIEQHNNELNTYVTDVIKNIPGLCIIGPKNPKKRGSILSFTVEKGEPHDIAMLLDKENIMVRSGVFCVHSWFNAHKIPGAIRVSFYLYNTKEEARKLVETLNDILT